MDKEKVELQFKFTPDYKKYSILLNCYRVGGMKWNDVDGASFHKIDLSKEDVLLALGVKQKISELETKLAEKDELLEDFRQFASKLKEELGNVDCEYKTQIFTLKRTLIDECKEHRDFCRIADEKVKELEQQLKEERKKVVQETKELVIKSTCYDTEEEVRNHLYDMSASEVLEILDQIEKGGNNGNQ